MRFAFDVDGLILEMPDLFSVLTHALKKAGHEIYIVTDFDEGYRQYRENELKNIGVVYDHLIITPHKEKFFLETSIDFAFDDDAEYYKNLKVLNMSVVRGNK